MQLKQYCKREGRFKPGVKICEKIYIKNNIRMKIKIALNRYMI